MESPGRGPFSWSSSTSKSELNNLTAVRGRMGRALCARDRGSNVSGGIVSTQRWFIIATLAGAELSGCASLPADYGRDDVAILLKERGHDVDGAGNAPAAGLLLGDLSGRHLTADDAVRFALVNNPRLTAEYTKLGFAAADVYDAGRLSNPRLSASVLLTGVTGFVDEHSFGLVQSFTSLLLLPARSRFAAGEFDRVRLLIGAATLNLAAETESTHYRLVGALQTRGMRESVARAAQASAELAQRFFEAGNLSRLELALEQAAASQARLDLLQAQAKVSAARGELNNLMGLSAQEDQWTVEERLSAPVADEDELSDLFTLAAASRLDLAAARRKVELFADALGVTRQFRYLGEVNIGVEATRISEGARLIGPTLSLELPIFNQGKGRVARSEAQLAQAEAELRTLETGASNGIRRAVTEVASAKARAEEYRNFFIPLRETIVARTLEQVNFMLEGQFELLLAKQKEYDAYQGYLEAVRDYWLARVELSRQIGAPLPSQAAVGDFVPVLPVPVTSGGHAKGDMHHGGGMEDMDESTDRMIDAEVGDTLGKGHSGHKLKEVDRNSSGAEPGGHEGHGKDMNMPKVPADEIQHGDHQ